MKRRMEEELKNKEIRKARIKYKTGHQRVFYAVLSDEERRYARERGATIENVDYKITVNFPYYFKYTSSTPNIVKTLFLKAKKEKRHVFVRKLSDSQKKACTSDSFKSFIKVEPHKCKVITSAI